MDWVYETSNHLYGLFFSVDIALSYLEKADECLPFRIMCKGVSISDNDKAVLGSCQRYIDAAFIVQKSNFASIIASDCRENHELFLPSLPAVDSSHIIFYSHIGQILFELLDLSLIRRDEPKFIFVVEFLEDFHQI